LVCSSLVVPGANILAFHPLINVRKRELIQMGVIQSAALSRYRNDRLQPIEDIICNIVQKSTPSYFLHEAVVTENDIKIGRMSWNLITSGDTATFSECILAGSYYSSPLSIFCKAFFDKLYHISPLSKVIFRRATEKSLESILISVVTTALRQLKDSTSFAKILHTVVHIHSGMGVKAVSCAEFGNALL